MPEGVEMTAGSKTFAAVNTKLVIWPDKLYLDMSTDPVSVKKLGATLTATGATVTIRIPLSELGKAGMQS